MGYLMQKFEYFFIILTIYIFNIWLTYFSHTYSNDKNNDNLIAYSYMPSSITL